MAPHSQDSFDEEVTFALYHPLRRFLIDAWRYGLAKVVPVMISFLSLAIFTHLFSPKGYGIYSLIVSIVAPIVVILSQWGAQPVGRFYSEYERSGELERYRSAVGFLILVVTFLAFLLGIPLFLSLGRTWGVLLGLAGALLLLTQSISLLLTPVITASLDPVFFRVIEISRAVLRLVVSLGLFLLLKDDPASLVWGMTAAFGILLPFLFQKAKKRMGGVKFSFNWTRDVKRFARYGAPMMLWFLAAKLLNVGDRYVIQLFRGSSEVGIYSANYNLAFSIATFFSVPMLNAAYPIIMYVWTSGPKDKVRKIISSITEWYLYLGISLLVCVGFLGRDVIALIFGKVYRQGHITLVPILAGQILLNISNLGHKGMELTENTMVMFKWALVAAFLNLLLNFILVPRFGYIAAAYTTFVGYLVYALLIWRSSRSYVTWEIPLREIGLAILIALFGMAIVYPLRLSSPIFQATLKTALFLLFYGAAIATLKRGQIRAAIQGRRAP